MDFKLFVSPVFCLGFLSSLLPLCFATVRYYGTYINFGSGDTLIQTFHAHAGPRATFRKWHAECLDGEGVVGLQDWVNDFQKIEVIWCKYLFPYKAPTNGIYPFYPNCHLRNYTAEFFCFDPQNVVVSVNTFITGFWDNDLQFLVSRRGGDDTNLYKCCRVPPGYFIDYPSCYYAPTHDQYWEYYDSIQHVVTYCSSGFVMTGISKKINPYDQEWHIDWLQCCRIGFAGAVPESVQQRPYKRDSSANSQKKTLRLPAGKIPSNFNLPLDDKLNELNMFTEANATFSKFGSTTIFSVNAATIQKQPTSQLCRYCELASQVMTVKARPHLEVCGLPQIITIEGVKSKRPKWEPKL